VGFIAFFFVHCLRAEMPFRCRWAFPRGGDVSPWPPAVHPSILSRVHPDPLVPPTAPPSSFCHTFLNQPHSHQNCFSEPEQPPSEQCCPME
jgi:hypothetical protein